MNVFSAGTPVTLAVPLVDYVGNQVDVARVEYRVTDQEGIEIVPLTQLTDFVAGSDVATVSIAPLGNTLKAGAKQALRVVELNCTLADSNTWMTSASYVISTLDPLVAGANSFMTYAQAEFTSISVPNLDSWNAADPRARIAALIDAREHICQLSFTPLNAGVNWGQDSLNYIPEGTRSTNYVGGLLSPGGDLSQLTPDQFSQLPPRFIDALAKAQLVEADSILAGDSVERKRRDGLIQDVVGESSQTFRQGKPLDMPVSRRALRYLSLYITFAKRIGRG
ncbi:hypothetical protein [Duganella sp. FT27W]|uniref:hypothetical protein n=1 Tax=Duganella sp. FT27W TaxID=2654636 RepID=UPI00128D1CA8|nr:hypothetical protein [Duganella sp. FT27W]MPQ56298.1 hypothetical protein [Duganella sp. FT27W]